MFYLIGGYIKTYVDIKNITQKGKVLLFITAVSSWIVDFVLMFCVDEKRYIINNQISNMIDTIYVMLGNGIILAVPVVICSIAIFILF